jgi:hypothetical protein
MEWFPIIDEKGMVYFQSKNKKLFNFPKNNEVINE